MSIKFFKFFCNFITYFKTYQTYKIYLYIEKLTNFHDQNLCCNYLTFNILN